MQAQDSGGASGKPLARLILQFAQQPIAAVTWGGHSFASGAQRFPSLLSTQGSQASESESLPPSGRSPSFSPKAEPALAATSQLGAWCVTPPWLGLWLRKKGLLG